MLHRYLREWALNVDEHDFRVTLRDGIDEAANRNFEERPSALPAIDDIISRALWSRLEAAGVRPSAGDRVVDVCAGRGHLGELLRVECGARVTFADLSVAQLAQLVQRVDREGGAAACACVADLLHLPYRSNSFDFVVGHSFLHHVRDVPAAIAELFRISRPGGRIALLHEPNVNANFWESFPLSLLKNTDPVEGFADLWMFRPDDLVRLLVQGGFSNTMVRGTGILSALLINWYLILLGKLAPGWARAFVVGYRLRARMNEVELKRRRRHVERRAPSLIVTAVKPVQASRRSTV